MTDIETERGNLPGTADFFRVGNYAPVADELTEFDLPVDGAIPPELDGLVPAQRTQSASADRALVRR